VYSYNAYFFNNYQHSGVYNAPYSSNPPSQAEIDSKARGILSRFYSKVYNRVETKKLQRQPFLPVFQWERLRFQRAQRVAQLL